MLSNSEKERLAYMQGYVEHSTLFATLDDFEINQESLETQLYRANYTIKELKTKLLNAKEDIKVLEDESLETKEIIDELQLELSNLKGEN
jgi:peptidoglycan hydrolase CwlO-like protein